MLKWFVADAPIRTKMMIVTISLVTATTCAGLFGLYKVQVLSKALISARVPNAAALVEDTSNAMLVAIVSGACICLALGLWFRKMICDPYVNTVVRMEALAAGDVKTPIERMTYQDCVGRTSRAMETFRLNAIEVGNLEAQAQQRSTENAQQKSASMNALANSFESSVAHVVETLASAATELEAT